MTSLRSRLILGSSLVTFLPLAIAIYLLTARIEATVRAQAAERVGAALGAMQGQLDFDSRRVLEQIQLIGRDPQLKRAYLLRAVDSRELPEYLTDRQLLFGLGLLEVTDTAGVLLARGARAVRAGSAGPASPGDGGLAQPFRAGPIRRSAGPFLERLEGTRGLAVQAAAPIRYQGKVAGLVRGGVAIDSAAVARLGLTSGVELVLRDAEGRTVLSTLAIPPGLPAGAAGNVERIRLGGQSYLTQSVPLRIGTPPYASLAGFASTAPADQTIAALRLTSTLLGVAGLAIAIVLGMLWSSQVSRPVERLAAFSEKMARGEWDEPLDVHGAAELRTLAAALDRMRHELRVSRARLVVSERQVAWSQMARKVAHEIKNPLTPIAISVADLKRSYEQNRPDFPEILSEAVRTISDEIEVLKRILQEFSDFARFPAPQLAPFRVSSLMDDLRTLYRREAEAGRLLLPPQGSETIALIDPGQIRQALVNLIQNGLEAAGDGGRVAISTSIHAPELEIAVSDTGPGLTAEQEANLFVPGFTTKSHGSGLGLTIVERIVSEHGGSIRVDSRAGSGTTFRIRLPLAKE